jgi:bifunctional oligoribonuclease and PAP phosphatase NrnA
MKQTGRAQRVAEVIRHEIGELLIKGLKDPRIGFVSIMRVTMSPDLCYANVYVSLYGSEEEKKSSLIGLRHSAGWIRRQTGRKIRLRVTPEIRFFPDDTLDKVYHLEEIFHQIHEEEKKSPMIHLSLAEVLAELQKADSFLVTSHQNPDGDAVGSILGMRALLHALGKTDIVCVMEDCVPARYAGLPGAGAVIRPEDMAPFEGELAIILDSSNLDRIGNVAALLPEECRTLILDHHLAGNPDAAAGHIDASRAAAGEIIAELYTLAGAEMTVDAAHCLYVALATDTGGFRFTNTSPRAHRIAAHLLESGIDVAAISTRIFDTIARPKFELLRVVLDAMRFRAGGAIAWTVVRAPDLEKAGAHKEDMDGLVNYTRYIEGVRIGILFHETAAGVTKVSFRSDDSFNSAAFLSAWGGGGHAAAAGATIEQPLHEIEAEILESAERRYTTRDQHDSTGNSQE